MARRRRSKYTLWAIVSTILILGLALGLGLGFSLRHGPGSPSKPSPTRPPTPTAVWQPDVGASWQIVLNQVLDIDDENPVVEPDVGVFDIDMFLHQNSTVVANLHKLGKKVICYFSAGSFENDRPDSYRFQESDLGKEVKGWPGERWLNLSSPSVRDIMASRVDIASQMGCDAIDPDNVDGYQNDNGLSLTSDDSVEFLDFLVDKASALNLAVGLKNAGDIISDALPLVQFAVNEQCAQFDNCGPFRSFIKAKKPVFHIEYPTSAPSSVSAADSVDACTSPGSNDFSTIMKTMKLDGWAQYCTGDKANTNVFS
ncbi:endo alpha-1,4 polygalactosaminidase precursor [Cercophora newfieldiana]|uniref:alpha-galactosidase n=1 Tax=Cercophora newfieldiana TaxID=92897 RepID=A0AA39Y1P7_9PEZI|nr:endo alpha-1,4 polygalactosaminidase precursor [Cercophora newfieldiana]